VEAEGRKGGFLIVTPAHSRTERAVCWCGGFPTLITRSLQHECMRAAFEAQDDSKRKRKCLLGLFAAFLPLGRIHISNRVLRKAQVFISRTRFPLYNKRSAQGQERELKLLPAISILMQCINYMIQIGARIL